MKTNDYVISRLWIPRVVLDIVSFLIGLIVYITVHAVAKPFEIGFYCNDASIRYPLKANTISFVAVGFISILCPLTLILVSELARYGYMKKYKKNYNEIYVCVYFRSVRYRVQSIVRNIYVLFITFAFGFIMVMNFTEVAKVFLGRLRPNFIAVCDPPDIVCSTSKSYVTNYTCRGDEKAVKDSRKSFVSGHTSAMWYSMTWCAIYVYFAWGWRHLGLLVHFLQMFFFFCAFAIGFTRITDFKHHWSDVFAGAVLGVVMAAFNYYWVLLRMFRKPLFFPTFKQNELITDF